MVDCKTKIKKLMFQLGLRQTLPAQIINQVKIIENNEELINIANDTDFAFASKLQSEAEIFLRKTVVKKLKAASQELPEGIKFKIYSAYRNLNLQKQMWEKRFTENAQKFPQLNLQDIENITRTQIADPNNGFGGHQTGGAVDLTLCDSSDNDLDMGTRISEHNKLTKTNSTLLTNEQQKNRKLLYTILEHQGFKNYPAEWWHFSYGDRMWAAYSQKKECFYGLVKP